MSKDDMTPLDIFMTIITGGLWLAWSEVHDE
jgi:hypothetical protein